MNKFITIFLLILIPLCMVLLIRHKIYCINDCYLYDSDGVMINKYVTKSLSDGNVVMVPDNRRVEYCIDKTSGETVSYISDEFLLISLLVSGGYMVIIFTCLRHIWRR